MHVPSSLNRSLRRRSVIAITRWPYCFINVLYLALVRISAEEAASTPEESYPFVSVYFVIHAPIHVWRLRRL
jgi:hypothetical protein